MLKEARYKCWGFDSAKLFPDADLEFPEFNTVVYAIIGECCYFSGIEREKRTSTINAADSIIEAISKQEDVSIERLRWFDLQTHRGYKKQSGEYELDEVLIGFDPDGPHEGSVTPIAIGGDRGEIHEGVMITQDTQDFTVSWTPRECPPEVLELFKEFIGQPPLCVLTAEEADRRGFHPTGTRTTIEVCMNFVAFVGRCYKTEPEFVLVDLGAPAERRVGTDNSNYELWSKPSFHTWEAI